MVSPFSSLEAGITLPLAGSLARFTSTRPNVVPIETLFALAAKETSEDDASDPRLHPPIGYRSVFISDTHLGTRGCCAGDLIKFLNHIKPDYLFILGDLFDCWQMGGLDFSKIYEMSPAQLTVLTKMRKLNRKGAKIVYIPGNHDEIVRDKLTSWSDAGDMAICFDATHDTADGKRLLLMHGDNFDEIVRGHRWLGVLGTKVYETLAQISIGIDKWRADIRINRFFEALGCDRHWSLAQAIRGATDDAAYNASYEKAMLLYFAARNIEICTWNKGKPEAQQIKPYDGLICGHTHVPAAKSIPLSTGRRDLSGLPEHMLFLNTGSWVGRPQQAASPQEDGWRENLKYPTCTAVVERHDGGLEHVQWSPQKGIVPLVERDEVGSFVNKGMSHPAPVVA